VGGGKVAGKVSESRTALLNIRHSLGVDITCWCVYYVPLIYLWARYKRISISILFVWPAAAFPSLFFFSLSLSPMFLLLFFFLLFIFFYDWYAALLFMTKNTQRYFWFCLKNLISNSCWHHKRIFIIRTVVASIFMPKHVHNSSRCLSSIKCRSLKREQRLEASFWINF